MPLKSTKIDSNCRYRCYTARFWWTNFVSHYFSLSYTQIPYRWCFDVNNSDKIFHC